MFKSTWSFLIVTKFNLTYAKLRNFSFLEPCVHLEKVVHKAKKVRKKVKNVTFSLRISIMNSLHDVNLSSRIATIFVRTLNDGIAIIVL